MNITTKAQAKKTASALRRELKEIGKAPSELKHNDILSAMAKAFGYSSWNEWNASLLDEEIPTAPVRCVLEGDFVSHYLLTNEGQFDFIPNGEDGQPFSSFFDKLVETKEILPGYSGVDCAARQKDGGLRIDYTGETDVQYDQGETETNEEGASVWINEEEGEESGNRLVLLPDGYNGDPYTDGNLPVREALLKEFETYFIDNGLVGQVSVLDETERFKEVINETEAKLGFALTAKEETALIERMRKLQK